MFIGFDIGNTSTVLGIYQNNSDTPVDLFRYPTRREITSRELYDTIENYIGDIINGDSDNLEQLAVAFSSVVPEINRIYSSMAWDFLGVSALEISTRSSLSIKIDYDNHEQLGVDRVVNTEAAHRVYGPGCIVIDIGTAVTFDILSYDSVFEGGIIAPGIETSMRALSLYASKLPEVDFKKPDSIVAKDTNNALKSGFYYGWVSMIEGVVTRIEKYYGKEFRIVLTGGLAKPLLPELKQFREISFDPLLTMKGIKIIHDNKL